MTCQKTIDEQQTELNFFHQLTANPDPAVCCGPIVTLGFLGPVLDGLRDIISALDLPPDYLDTFDSSLLDSGVLLVMMCSRHWMKHSEAIATVGIHHDNDFWLEIAYYIYTFMCQVNNWDYKEITNYTKTANFLKQKDI